MFVSAVTVGNEDYELRPGMRGIASILSGERSLGWVLFHRAWEQVAVWLNIGDLDEEESIMFSGPGAIVEYIRQLVGIGETSE